MLGINWNRSVKEVLDEEVLEVDSYRESESLPHQGQIDIRVSKADLSKTCRQVVDEDGSHTHLASSRTQDYFLIEENNSVADANGGENLDVQGWDKDGTGNGSMRHRGFRSKS